MPAFIAKEYDFETHTHTGKTEVYDATDLNEAQAKLLYTRRLVNGRARPGGQGPLYFRFVYVGERCWGISLEDVT